MTAYHTSAGAVSSTCEYFEGRFRQKAEELIRFSVAVARTRSRQRSAEEANRPRRPYNREEVVRRYVAGEAMVVLAREYGVHHRRVAADVKAAGHVLRSSLKLTREERWALGDKYVDDFNRGMSFREIGLRHGLSMGRVQHILSDHPRRVKVGVGQGTCRR